MTGTIVDGLNGLNGLDGLDSLNELYAYQTEHLNRLLAIFEQHKVAIDCSITGAGKTLVSLHLAIRMVVAKALNAVIIVCPPTLQDHWKSYTQSQKLPITVVSCHSLQKLRHRLKSYGKFLLIVDECHLFKNNVQRTGTLKTISKNSAYTLMLSATPYDDNRQFSNIRELFSIHSNIQEHVSKMDFQYKIQTHFDYYHVQLSEEKLKEYNKGYHTLCYSVVSRDGMEQTFRPSVFTAGIQMIHDTLMEGCCTFLKENLEQHPTHKFVVVLNFVRHFDQLEEFLQNEGSQLLILNGSTPIADRAKVIAQFQQEDNQYRVIAISAEVGSVGIELDDKSGSFPRHMICLPMTNAINFCQAIGRIQRTKTKSDSRVTVIQPPKKVTYFKTQVNRKFKVLSQFMSTPSFTEINPPSDPKTLNKELK